VLLVVAATERELESVQGAQVFCCGVGPVEAAAATPARRAGGRADPRLHVGIAGCRRGCGLEPGSVVIGGESRYCDTGSKLVVARTRPANRLLDAARAAIPGAPVLPIGTSAEVGGTHGCDVEAMEGFAVLRAAELAAVPALEVRAISNEIEEPDRARWRFDTALAALAEAVPLLVAELSR
jgi:nucleoside phosphorylase